MKPKILILDYSVDGSETPVIKSWFSDGMDVTSLFIDSEESFPKDLIQQGFTHVIHSGSALSINEESPFTNRAVEFIRNCTTKGIWQMGICYGHQLLGMALIGKHAVRSSPLGFEAGWCEVRFNEKARELMKLDETEILWQHHFDEVTELPNGSELLATSCHSEIQAYINYELCLFGTQFHPEYAKESGNMHFLRDRALLESYNFEVDEIIKYGPSLDAGKVFFEFFLNPK